VLIVKSIAQNSSVAHRLGRGNFRLAESRAGPILSPKMQVAPSVGMMKVLVLLSGVSYLGLALFAVFFANQLVFPAPVPGYSDSPDILKFPYNESGESVSMVYLDNPRSRYLVFYHHGNGEDLKSTLPRLEKLRQMGHSVLSWDYPGYGTSDGKPNEALVLDIADRIWKQIPRRYGFDHKRVLLYGRSLGGGPATWLAHRYPAAGLVMEGSFTSIFRVGLPARILPWDIFDNLKLIDSITCPVLFIHGTDDQTVPFDHSVKLHEKAPKPKFFAWVDGAGHNDVIESYTDIYDSSLNRFIQSL
jgi:pimeloyl-ACP methyl ester carboxylesterase